MPGGAIDLGESLTQAEFSIVLTAHPIGGQATRSDESTDVRWVPPAEIPDYTMDRAMRLRVAHYLEKRASPVII